MAAFRSRFKSAHQFSHRLLNNYRVTLKRQQAALQMIQSLLPAHLAEHALYCVIAPNKVVVYTDSSTWTSQLRFYQSDLLTKLAAGGFHSIEKIQFKVIQTQSTQTHWRKPSLPSVRQIDEIRQLASNQKDDKLNSALMNLSKTLHKLSKQQD